MAPTPDWSCLIATVYESYCLKPLTETDQNKTCKHHLHDNKQFILTVITSASVSRAQARVQHFFMTWGATGLVK